MADNPDPREWLAAVLQRVHTLESYVRWPENTEQDEQRRAEDLQNARNDLLVAMAEVMLDDKP